MDMNQLVSMISKMSGKDLESLASLLVEKHDEKADHLCSYLESYMQDKIVSENDDQCDIVRGDETKWI